VSQVDRTFAPSPERLVRAADRYFPVAWIGLYLLLPVSGWAGEMFESWHDQRKFLEALNAVVLEGSADDLRANILGPAYIGFAAVLHVATGMSPEDSLVNLNRASYALSVAAALLLVRVLVARLVAASPVVSLGSQLVLLALFFAAGTWYWSDVPWSHFFAALLAVGLYAVRFAPSRPGTGQAVAVGVVVALLAATRTFELLAVLLAWGIVAVTLRLLDAGSRPVGVRLYVYGSAAFAVTTALVYAGTGKRELFLLYGDNLGRQSAAVLDAEVAATPTFSFSLVPVKLVQLFVDPCYLSLCRVSDYEAGGGAGTNLDLWSLPLAIQLPALVLLPLCIGGIALLGVRMLKVGHREELATAWKPLAEMTVAATGLVVGYVGSTLTGPSHLRYGLARDFLLPAALTAVVAVALGSLALWRLLQRAPIRRVSPGTAFALLALVGSVAVVSVVTVARSSGLPRLESRHLEAVTYTARCDQRRCRVDAVAKTPAGKAISMPERSTLTFGCGSARPRFTLYVTSLGAVTLDRPCRDPRLVAAWPTIMGLPPGSYELAAVRVRNLGS
jgi:hypothetical protein